MLGETQTDRKYVENAGGKRDGNVLGRRAGGAGEDGAVEARMRRGAKRKRRFI